MRQKTIKLSDVNLVFSYYIRLRDADDYGFCQCITCGKLYYFYYLDNGHHIKRQWKGTLFNEVNCNAQCKACNNWGQGADAEYAEAIKKKFGEEKYLLLKAIPKHRKKHKSYELEQIAKEYIPKVEAMLHKISDADIKEKVIKKLESIKKKLC